MAEIAARFKGFTSDVLRGEFNYRIPPEIVSLILRIREADSAAGGAGSFGPTRSGVLTTILKLFYRHHVGQISKKKYRPGPKPADAPLQVPGRSVQLDVKFVPQIGRARQRFYRFTAIDEATRFRVLRIYDHNNTKTAIELLSEVRERFPNTTRTDRILHSKGKPLLSEFANSLSHPNL